MSQLLHHSMPCHECGSSDALSEYENGTFCFSCKHSTFKKKSSSARLEPEEVNLGNIGLPPDTTYNLPQDIRAWLYKYHFTDELIAKYHIGHSVKCEMFSKRLQKIINMGPRVIFPIFKDAEVINYEARSLDPDNKIKYVSGGPKTDLFIAGDTTAKHDCVVIVEDMLSAIRVGETMPTVALRGTAYNLNTLLKLEKLSSHFIVWLDGDRPGKQAAIKLKKQLAWFGKVYYINSNKDPKAYSNKEIVKFIHYARKGT